MATWDSADLLARLTDKLARPSTDAELGTLRGYGLLTEAQLAVAERLAMVAPESNYVTALFTTADSKLYTLATAGQEWLGEIEVYRDSTLRGLPMSFGALWDPRKDWAVETSRTIRLCGGRTKSYPTLTARIFPKPGILDAGAAPTLLPADLRLCVVYLAAALFCDRGGKRDPSAFYRNAESNFQQKIAPMRSLQSSGVGTGTTWWTLGDLGRMG